MAFDHGWYLRPPSEIDVSQVTSHTFELIQTRCYPSGQGGYVLYGCQDSSHLKGNIIAGICPANLINLGCYHFKWSDPCPAGHTIYFSVQCYCWHPNGYWVEDGWYKVGSVDVTGSSGGKGTASVTGKQGTDLIDPSGESNVTLKFSGWNAGSYSFGTWSFFVASQYGQLQWSGGSGSGSKTITSFPSAKQVGKGTAVSSATCSLSVTTTGGQSYTYQWTVKYGKKATTPTPSVPSPPPPPPPPQCSTPNPSLSPTSSDVSNQGNLTINVSWAQITGAVSYSLQITCKGKTVTATSSTNSYSFNLKQKFPGVTFAEGDTCYVQVQAIGSTYRNSGWGKTGNHTITRDRGSSPTAGYIIGRRNKRNMMAWKGDRVTLHYSGQRDGSYAIARYEFVRIDNTSVKKTWTPSQATKSGSEYVIDVTGITLPGPGKDATFELRAYDTNGEAVYMNGGKSWLRIAVKCYPGLMWRYGEDHKWHEVDVWVCTNPDSKTWKNVGMLWLRIPNNTRSDEHDGKWVAL